MGKENQPYVVCIGNAELLQDLRFDPDAQGVIQPSNEWRWKSFAGLLAHLLGNLGCKTKLITKANSDPSGRYLQQLLERSGLDVRVVSEPWRGIPESRPSHAIETRVMQKDEPPSFSVSRHTSGPNLRFDEIPMEDLQEADLVVIASPLESKPGTRSGGSSGPTCGNFRDYEWRRLNDTLSGASQIGRQGIPVMCMMGLPILGVMDEMVGYRIDELLPHLQHINFLLVGGLFEDRHDAVLAMFLQKLKTELPHVFFTEIVVVVAPPAPPAAEQGASCSLQSPYKRFMCLHTLTEESSVPLDSKLKPDEQDVMFFSGFIASHVKGSSIKDSMEQGAQLSQDAELLAALTGR